MHSTIVDLAAIRHQPDWKHWQQLTASAPPFLTPEFFTLASRFGDEEPMVAEAWDDTQLVGALPLVRRGNRVMALRCEYTPGFDYYGSPAGVDAIWDALRADTRWTELVLDKIPSDSLLAVHLPALANAAGYPTVLRLDTRHPWFALPGFEAALSAKFRTNLQRCARKAGGITLERIAIPDRAAFDEALALEAMAWKGHAGTSIDGDPQAAQFYRVLSRLLGRRGAGALYFLRAGDRRIATLFAVEDTHTLFALKIGYDPSAANLSPGHLLVWKVAADAEARGLQAFDFVGRDDEWKRKWTTRAREYVSLTVYRDSTAGLLRYALRQLVRPHMPELARGCQRSDIVGAHTLVGRVRGRLDRGLGIKHRLLATVKPPPARDPLGAASQFAPGSWVRVKNEAALRDTLDDNDKTRGLLFADVQRETFDHVYRVAKVVRRLRDDHGRFRPIARTVLLDGVDCSGHGDTPTGCGRHCPMMYRDEWLEPAEAPSRGPTEARHARHARVRDLDEIRAGLDLRGRHHGVTFMPEMAQYAGRRFAIANRITQVFEYDRWITARTPIYILDGLHCSGAVDAGPCDRACTLLWSEDWLTLDP